MKKVNRIISIIICYFLAIALFSSCLSATGELNSDDNNSTQQNEPESSLDDVSQLTVEISGSKREFLLGEEFSFDGIVVVLKDGDDTKPLSEKDYEIDFSAYNSLIVGTYTIVVRYKSDADVKAEYTVVVQSNTEQRDEDNESVWGKDFWL